MGLDYRDIGTIANRRFWRRREWKFWIGFAVALIMTLVICFQILIPKYEVNSQPTIYKSDSYTLQIEKGRYYINGEELGKISPVIDPAQSGYIFGLVARDTFISSTPLIAWIVLYCIWFDKARKYRVNLIKQWQATGQVPDAEV